METLQLKVKEGTGKQKFQCSYEFYDRGDAVGHGDSIQEAIKQFLISFELKFDFMPEYRWK